MSNFTRKGDNAAAQNLKHLVIGYVLSFHNLAHFDFPIDHIVDFSIILGLATAIGRPDSSEPPKKLIQPYHRSN